MSKYIVIHDGETIKHIEQIGHNFSARDILVVDEIPVAEQREGYFAVLSWSEESGLHYEYYEVEEAE